jgi:heme exporter protein A
MLSVENLKDKRILKTENSPLSFIVNASKAYAIKGPNGCGKTSLLRMIVGILEPDSCLHMNISSSYAYLPSQNGLYHSLKVHDYLKKEEDIFNSLLFDRFIYELSAGQQRQLALLLLKNRETQFWIIDEPTTHLDSYAISLFYESVKSHCESGGGVLISTHEDTPEFFDIIDLGDCVKI